MLDERSPSAPAMRDANTLIAFEEKGPRQESEPSEVPKEPESLFDFNFRQSDEAAH